MTTQQLTATQHAVLAHAIEHHDGKITWFPEHVKGGARTKVLQGLAGRNLIAAQDADWLVADDGYAALGLQRPAPMPLVNDPEIEAVVTAAEAEWTRVDPQREAPQEPEHQTQPQAEQPQEQAPATAGQGRTRENTKQALVIQMLKRPEGATVAQIMEATGWLNHTVRGTLSGVLRKRLGLKVVSAKNPEGVSAYRIA
jgi:hypothetical protein